MSGFKLFPSASGSLANSSIFETIKAEMFLGKRLNVLMASLL